MREREAFNYIAQISQPMCVCINIKLATNFTLQYLSQSIKYVFRISRDFNLNVPMIESK